MAVLDATVVKIRDSSSSPLCKFMPAMKAQFMRKKWDKKMTSKGKQLTRPSVQQVALY